MKITKTKIDNCFIIRPTEFNDERGSLVKYMNEDYSSFFNNQTIKQINISKNKIKGTFRGMHSQIQPYQECKLISCLSGSFVDFFLEVAGSNGQSEITDTALS